MSNVSKSKRRRKPDKPYEEFPLFPHQNGQWAKKIKGRLHYFGLWEDWEEAKKLFERERDDLYAGRSVSAASKIITIHASGLSRSSESIG
jgi:hypothetical protein